MRAASVLLLLTVMTACVPYARTPKMAAQVGDYSYRFETGTERFTGTFSIAGDSIVVDSDDCEQGRTYQHAYRAQSFACHSSRNSDRVTVTFDKLAPLKAFWVVARTDMRTRSVCAGYAMTSNGVQYCTGFRTESYPVTSYRTGRIDVDRIIAAP